MIYLGGARMRIDTIESGSSGSIRLLRARVARGDLSAPLWFRWRGEESVRVGDALLLAMLQSAMASGEEISIDAPISAELTGGLEELLRALQEARPELRRVAVHTAGVEDVPVQEPAATPDTTAIWFDSSVVSFFAYLRCREEVDAILFPIDFVDDSEVTFREGRGIKSARHRAAELGKPLLPLESNLRDIARTFGAELWDPVWYGVAAHLLRGEVRRLVLPSTGVNGSDVRTFVNSSGAADRLGFVALGDGADDAEMNRALASDWITLEALRVCWDNPYRSYNCGRCSKCTRSVPARRLVELLARESRSRRRQAQYPVSIKTEERSHGAFEVARDR